jgi:hypothetical protein
VRRIAAVNGGCAADRVRVAIPATDRAERRAIA